jgi:hypothetical protein
MDEKSVIHVVVKSSEKFLFDKFCKDNFLGQRGAIMMLLKNSGYELDKDGKFKKDTNV